MSSSAEILKIADGEKVRFLRLQFNDIMGVLKNVEVPRSQFEKALDRKSTRLNSSHSQQSRMPSSA